MRPHPPGISHRRHKPHHNLFRCSYPQSPLPAKMSKLPVLLLSLLSLLSFLPFCAAHSDHSDHTPPSPAHPSPPPARCLPSFKPSQISRGCYCYLSYTSFLTVPLNDLAQSRCLKLIGPKRKILRGFRFCNKYTIGDKINLSKLQHDLLSLVRLCLPDVKPEGFIECEGKKNKCFIDVATVAPPKPSPSPVPSPLPLRCFNTFKPTLVARSCACYLSFKGDVTVRRNKLAQKRCLQIVGTKEQILAGAKFCKRYTAHGKINLTALQRYTNMLVRLCLPGVKPSGFIECKGKKKCTLDTKPSPLPKRCFNSFEPTRVARSCFCYLSFSGAVSVQMQELSQQRCLMLIGDKKTILKGATSCNAYTKDYKIILKKLEGYMTGLVELCVDGVEPTGFIECQGKKKCSIDVESVGSA